MPNPVNARRGEQWDTCDKCGFFYPMSQLVKQKGKLVCTKRHCFDNLTVERRDYVIGEILKVAVDQEGADLRVIDRGFFDGMDPEGVS